MNNLFRGIHFSKIQNIDQIRNTKVYAIVIIARKKSCSLFSLVFVGSQNGLSADIFHMDGKELPIKVT